MINNKTFELGGTKWKMMLEFGTTKHCKWPQRTKKDCKRPAERLWRTAYDHKGSSWHSRRLAWCDRSVLRSSSGTCRSWNESVYQQQVERSGTPKLLLWCWCGPWQQFSSAEQHSEFINNTKMYLGTENEIRRWRQNIEPEQDVQTLLLLRLWPWSDDLDVRIYQKWSF